MKVPQNKKIILFDGVCNLCNSAVQTVIKHDVQSVFRFAPLQSDIGKQLLEERGISTEKFDSIILIVPGEAYYEKSTAALEIAKHLKGYKWLRILNILPSSLNDRIYDLVARNRYKWYGKKESCMIPTPELQELFLK